MKVYDNGIVQVSAWPGCLVQLAVVEGNIFVSPGDLADIAEAVAQYLSAAEEETNGSIR